MSSGTLTVVRHMRGHKFSVRAEFITRTEAWAVEGRVDGALHDTTQATDAWIACEAMLTEMVCETIEDIPSQGGNVAADEKAA